ncbi:MAG: hypothetical protein ACNS63_04205 [Candidatus Nitrospinota bacterium M3_3B_026]
MTTLIAVYDSDGLVGRCDARCHDATTAHCNCVCGGMNHGAGAERALENTREYAKDMIDRYAGEKGLDVYKVVIGEATRQESLFNDENA